jgi:hypothetical protein
MPITRQKTEITVRTTNPAEKSAVALITRYLDVDILAMRSYGDREGDVTLLISSDVPKTLRALQASGLRCKTNPVVLVGPLARPGLAAPIGSQLVAVGIEVQYSYSSQKQPRQHYLVFRTASDERACRVIEDIPFLRNQATGETRRRHPQPMTELSAHTA